MPEPSDFEADARRDSGLVGGVGPVKNPGQSAGRPPRPDAVLLVHGTFAFSKDEIGRRFYQKDSPFWNWLNARLGGHAMCAPPFEPIYKWGEHNSNSERAAAQRRDEAPE